MSYTYHSAAMQRRAVSQRPLFRVSIPFVVRLFICLACVLGASSQTRAAVAYVQGNRITLTTKSFTAASVTYSSAQQAGDLNIVEIANYNTTSGTIISVTDSVGNSYSAASNLNAKFVVFYAANIRAAGAGANSVTVTFSYPCSGCSSLSAPNTFVPTTLIVNIAEYSGIATTSALDVSVGANGSGANASSGQVSTTNANDLLIGAFSAWPPGTATPGAGYTARGGSGGGEAFIEDMTVASVGSYSATALSSGASSGWTIVLIAFRAQATGSICD